MIDKNNELEIFEVLFDIFDIYFEFFSENIFKMSALLVIPEVAINFIILINCFYFLYQIWILLVV